VSLVLKVVTKNNRDFGDVILIYVWVCVCSKSHGLLVYEKTVRRVSVNICLGLSFLCLKIFAHPQIFILSSFVA